ncbi:MAG: PLP-dependent aminotransferase family protein [Bacteroidales bacterium]|nr:PLP-dependent aminotransferase family protein [Candidatus Cryptobacteroides onthequi]
MLRQWNFEIELELDNKRVPVYKQLAKQIQQMIESGILKNGDLLPGGREIAKKLNISRKTVLSAMELLVYSGWLENRERVGLFVHNPQYNAPQTAQQAAVVLPQPHAPVTVAPVPSLVINDGYPDTKILSFKELSSAFRQLFNQAARWHMLGYSDPLGNVKLRTALSQGICHERGLQTCIEQLMLTRGSQQALYLVAHVLLHPGDAVVVEDPGYLNARRAFESSGLRVLPVPVDEEGLQTDKLKDLLATESCIRALYVTPRYQYPTTVTLSSVRRRQLVELVNAHNLLVVEDDFGCNFQFTEHHLKPLSVLLSPEHYIYIGTFSKILAPALRLGFVVTTPEFIKQMGDYRQLVDMQGDNVMERAILDLIEKGELKRHIRRASKVYRERLQYATTLIRKELGNNVIFKKPDGGLALWMEFEDDPTERLAQCGISATIEKLANQRFGLRVGYASMQTEEIDRLIMALKSDK